MNTATFLSSMAIISYLENIVNIPPPPPFQEPHIATTTTNMSSPPLFHPITRFDDPSWTWLNPPDGWTKNTTNDNDNDNREGKDGWWKLGEEDEETNANNNINNPSLMLAPPAKKDYWRKTYYEPLLVKDDASVYKIVISKDDLPVMIETSFELTPKSQFDQAGIMIRIDPEHWIKTGIEVVDGQPRLSCVVTNGFSDWSTQNWSTPSVTLRVHLLPQHGGSFVVEAAPFQKGNNDKNNNKGDDDNEYSFVRIAHMNKDMNHNYLNDDPIVQNAFCGESAPPNSYMVGVFAACPVDQQGMVATFYNISIVKGSTFSHTN